MNMIILSTAAHPCVELIHSDNRVHRGTLFICCWFGCILMEAERPPFTVILKKGRLCFAERASLLIEANISTVPLHWIWSVIPAEVLLNASAASWAQQDSNPSRISWIKLSIRTSLVFLNCELACVIPCLLIWWCAENHFPELWYRDKWVLYSGWCRRCCGIFEKLLVFG